MKVLVNAYAVSPDHGSEPGMGWNWCVRLARECELFIITEGEFREGIERELAVLPQGGNMHFYYLPISDRARQMCENQGDWRFYFYYSLWQKRALALARELHESYHFDIIHQLNMIGFREPGFLWKIQGPKFILGPIGGMSPTPLQYFRDAPLSLRMLLRAKNAINYVQSRFSVRFHRAVKAADVVLCATPSEQKYVRDQLKARTLWISETGGTDNPVGQEHIRKAPYHLIWVGKFMFRKQLGLALRVMAEMTDDPVVLDVVGSGSPWEESHYREIADKLHLGNKVVWHGQVSQKEVGRMMDAADIFFFTSVHEATSTVVMEAISHGLPIVCFDSCGYGPVVDERIGIRIPVSKPDESVRLFVGAIRKLVSSPQKMDELSSNTQEKVASLTWDAKIREVLSIYFSL